MPVQGAGPGEGAPRCLSAGRAGAVKEGEDRTESGKPPGAADFEQRPEGKKAGIFSIHNFIDTCNFGY